MKRYLIIDNRRAQLESERGWNDTRVGSLAEMQMGFFGNGSLAQKDSIKTIIKSLRFS